MYVLNSVLHGWGDDEATTILRRCAEVAGETGRVVVIEETGTAEDGDQAGFAEMNLRMLVFCGGRERSLDEYTALAAAAGLAVADTHTTPLGQAVIDCVASASAGRGADSLRLLALTHRAVPARTKVGVCDSGRRLDVVFCLVPGGSAWQMTVRGARVGRLLV